MGEDTQPEPDTKDWTWVLERRCPECGFEAGAFDPERTGDLVRANAGQWQELLAGPRRGLVDRPSPKRWSVLEYACHVRDVHRLFRRRLALMLEQDGPQFENWDQDATALDQDYASQDPGTVSGELVAAAREVADAFDAVRPDQWERTGHRSDGATFTVASFAAYFVHDPVHHIWDVGRGAEA